MEARVSATTPANILATYNRYSGLWERYHGSFPIGMMAAYATEESGGQQVCSGDDPNGESTCGGSPSVDGGEYGVFQITRATEARFGVPDGTRKQVEGNFFLAGAETNTNAAIAARKYGVPMGSQESWLLAFLAFAIGSGGTKMVWDAAVAAGYSGYSGLMQWAANGNAFPISGPSGTMPASTIVRRINIAASNWTAGVNAGLPMDTGVPFIPTAPGGVDASIPEDAAGLIGIGDTSAWWIAGVAALGYWLFTRKKR